MTRDQRTQGGDAPGDEPAPVPEPSGLAGWFTTADHKRTGRLYLVTALVFLLVGSALGALLGTERIDSGLELLTSDTFEQVYTLHGEVAVLLFLVPFFLGLATYLVPLQVGARDIAFPRGSVTAYWAYVVAGSTLLAAYVANGGPDGASRVGTDLYLLSLALLVLATGLALVSILTTVVALRAPGMSMVRAPLFTWSMLVGGGLTLLASPVLLARLVELYIQHHFTDDFAGPGAYNLVSWFWSVPQVYLLAVPAVGVVAEVVPVLAGRRLRRHESGIAVIAATGLVGFGAWAQVGEAFDDLLYVVAGLAAVLPALALLGIVGDALRRGRFSRRAPLVLALGAAVHLLAGAVTGALSVIPALELRGTAWEAAQIHFTLFGGAGLAAYAALWYWAPKIWGVHLSDGAGVATAILTFVGVALLAAPDLVRGLSLEERTMFVQFEGTSSEALSAISAAGGALAALAVLVVIADLVLRAGRRTGTRAIGDPWEGQTLEWTTSSPPPPANFSGPLPAVTSPYPAADGDGDGAGVPPEVRR